MSVINQYNCQKHTHTFTHTGDFYFQSRWNNKWHIYPSALNWTKYVIQQFSGIHTKRQHRIVLAGRRKTDTVGSTQQVPACCPVVVYRMQHREEDPPPQKSPAVQISSRRKLRVPESYRKVYISLWLRPDVHMCETKTPQYR